MRTAGDGPTIRQYQSGDESGCLACVIELQDSGVAIDPRLRHGAEMASEYLEQMHARCRDYSGAIFVAEESGEIIGLAMILARVPYESLDEPPGDYALVAELVVLDGHRHRGIGKALLQVSEQYARSAGANELRIGVLSQNQVARDLYVRQGFIPYSEMLAKPLTS
jgi:GNAT superfamily N-acetyltransferase